MYFYILHFQTNNSRAEGDEATNLIQRQEIRISYGIAGKVFVARTQIKRTNKAKKLISKLYFFNKK